jgi:hypothetical protein
MFEENAKVQYAIGGAYNSNIVDLGNVSIRENIARRIKCHEDAIAELRKIEESLSSAKSLLDMNINDLSNAMRY